jgi:hypothetical protein
MNGKEKLIFTILLCRKIVPVKHGLPRVLIMMTLFLLCAFQSTYSQSTEYELKAVAFQKLSLFIEWPQEAFENNGNEFVIGVAGNNPFGGLLESVYENVRIKEKKVKIIYIRDFKQILQCHILFIPKMSFKDLEKILVFIGTKPVLTIADSDGFAEAGCLINFYNYSGKLRFEVNQKAMLAAGFSIDFKLLNVSKIVNPAGK